MKNTNRELWRERDGDYYADSIHVTERGGIGINCGGRVLVAPLKTWHQALSEVAPRASRREAQLLDARAHCGDGDSAAWEAGAAVPRREADIAALIAQWRMNARLSGQFSIEGEVTPDHHRAAAQSATWSECADQLEQTLERSNPAVSAVAPVDGAQHSPSTRVTSLSSTS